MKLIKNNKGDTIVEVMIAIVVVSAALGGALAISSKSVKKTQANHERYQAQLLVNRQIELIRQDYAMFVAQGGSRDSYGLGDGNIAGLCKTPCSNDVNLPLNNSIVITTESGDTVGGISAKTYKITATWDSLINTGQDRVQLVYGL